MLRLDNTNFTQIIQEIMEKYYLQPLRGSTKINVKDGYIERPIHGAMHASRATVWALAMHNLLLTITPDYRNASLKKIADYLNCDTDRVLLLILVTMACHDAARQGEGQDHWEKGSAEIAESVLMGFSLNNNQANLFAQAISCKDNQANYLKVLSGLSIQANDYNAFDYIRKLVNLGDNLDLVRCVGQFKSDFIFKTLMTIDGYNAEKHDDIIMKMIVDVHQFVHNQHDMLFACNILDRKDVPVVKLQNSVINKYKVKIEHADNVFAVIFDQAAHCSAFQPFLANSNLVLPPSRLYQGKLKFNPFIHGTNSSIFSTLVKTEFHVMSPLQMMDIYQVAPMTGEMTAGGYDSVGSMTIHEETIGRTSFAKMVGVDRNSYTLERIQQSYTNLSASCGDRPIAEFKRAAANGVRQAFSNINLLTIYFTRARQVCESIDQVVTPDELSKLQNEINATAQFYYFFQLLGTHIHPDYKAMQKLDIAYQVSTSVKNVLKFEHIINKIIEHNLDMKHILENPTVENLTKALLVLEIPKLCKTRKSMFSAEIEIEFPQTQFFCLDGNYPDAKNSHLAPDYTFYRMSQNGAPGYMINDVLQLFIDKSLKKFFFEDMSRRCKKHLIALDDRVQLFNKLVQTPQSKFQLTEIQKYFLEQPLPLILISDNDEKISLYNNSSQEYRSTATLRIGSDIKMMATDSNDNRLKIMKILDQHHIHCVQVVLFSDLEQSKLTKEQPSDPYHHQDGVPTLKWLSAKQASVHSNSLFKVKQLEGKVTSELHSAKNIKEVTNLLEDAEKYNGIEFIVAKNSH